MSRFLQSAAAAVNGAAAGGQPIASPPETVDFPLDRIAPDTAAQTRVMLNATKVAEYAEAMRDPDLLAEFPPILLVEDADGTIRISRGYTRVAAAKAAGLSSFRAIIRQGTVRDAIVQALGSNATHGDKRTHADLLHELDMVLTDPELSKWSDREIARRVKCAHKTVGDRRRYWVEQGQEQTTERVRTDRHGNTTTINVGNIQQANAARASFGPKILDANHTYSVIQMALAQQEPGVQARFNWLRDHDAPADFSFAVPVGFALDERTFAGQWQRAYDELAKRVPRDQPQKVSQPTIQPTTQPKAQPQPSGNGSNSRFVPPVAPGVEYNKRGHGALGNLTVYLDGVLEELPKIVAFVAFDCEGYTKATQALLAQVNDLLDAMEMGHGERQD